MSYAKELERQVRWFMEYGGINLFNFCVLTEHRMLGIERARDKDEVLNSAAWAWVMNQQKNHGVHIRPARGYDCGCVFLDDVPIDGAGKIAKKYAALVIETSQENCQLWIATTEQLTESSRKVVQKAIAEKIGADAKGISGEHFGRAAGYKNTKQGRGGFIVRVRHAATGAKLNSAPYLEIAPETPPYPQRLFCTSSLSLLPLTQNVRKPLSGSGSDESGAEFGWACGRLRWAQQNSRDMNREIVTVTENITARALSRGKRKTESEARRYAEKLVADAMSHI